MEPTVRITRSPSGAPEAVGARPGLAVASASTTHPGVVKDVNEDSYLDRSDLGLWAVADGVGGSFHGQEASRRVSTLLGAIPLHADPAALMVEVRANLARAHEELSPKESATTVVVLLAHSAHYACVWAGDSRLYLRRGCDLYRLTRDHSEVQELVDMGLLDERDAETYPRRNVVTRAIGSGQPLELDMIHAPIEPGDLFLICTDGLTKVLSDPEIHRELDTGSERDIVDRLVGTAVARGARDNVTAVVVRFTQHRSITA